MRFVDELFDYYKGLLIADEEDIDLLVAALLQELSREDMVQLLAELTDIELNNITGTYIANELRKKIIEEQDQDGNTEGEEFFH